MEWSGLVPALAPVSQGSHSQRGAAGEASYHRSVAMQCSISGERRGGEHSNITIRLSGSGPSAATPSGSSTWCGTRVWHRCSCIPLIAPMPHRGSWTSGTINRPSPAGRATACRSSLRPHWSRTWDLGLRRSIRPGWVTAGLGSRRGPWAFCRGNAEATTPFVPHKWGRRREEGCSKQSTPTPSTLHP
jgi:hypothetical protein